MIPDTYGYFSSAGLLGFCSINIHVDP